jgi:hypothetical protein
MEARGFLDTPEAGTSKAMEADTSKAMVDSKGTTALGLPLLSSVVDLLVLLPELRRVLFNGAECPEAWVPVPG